MNKQLKIKKTAVLLSTLVFTIPLLVGCGASTTNTSNLPPLDDSARYSSSQNSAPVHHGMSNGQKAVLLVGAAALYYMYQNNQKAHQNGASVSQYYLSKNGRVYYREQGGRVHWVTAPSEGIQVPAAEASQYQNLQGYEGRASGRDLAGIGNGNQ